jgi:hypothetical protein
MTRVVGLVLAALLFSATHAFARAELPAECRVVEHHVENELLLPHVRKAIEQRKLDVLVIGAGSSTLPGTLTGKAYPGRLEAALSENLPGVAVKVVTEIKPGRTAADSIKPLTAGLAAVHPALVVWQSGTVDAMRSVDLDGYSAALDRGVVSARAAHSDVILMNAQYSPRTESIIALGSYTDNMRWVALRHEVPLFDRFGLMKLWAELGTFDFGVNTKKPEMAEQVHDCIGRLLADLILNGAKSTGAPADGAR